MTVASFDWQIFWDRIAHPDHAFLTALLATIYIAVIAQILGVVLGLIAALGAALPPSALFQWISGYLRLDLPRDARDRADLLRLLRRQHPLRDHRDPELARRSACSR